MAEQYLINDTTLTSIADAIRTKYNDATKYLPREMPPAIRGIPDFMNDWAALAQGTIHCFNDVNGLVSALQYCAFSGCNDLESVYLMHGSVVSMSYRASSVFGSNWSHITYYVPSSLYSQYISATNWSNVSNYITGV